MQGALRAAAAAAALGLAFAALGLAFAAQAYAQGVPRLPDGPVAVQTPPAAGPGVPPLPPPAQSQTPAAAGSSAAPSASPDKAAEPAAPKPPANPKFDVSWDNGGMRYKTADDAFSVHVGGRLVVDSVWWTQSPGLRASPGQPAGSPLSTITGVGAGTGDYLDGMFIRRARVVADGVVYRSIEFKTEFDFENYNNIAFDESYIGVRDLPFFDAVRFGQTHVPFGLEAFTSSRYLPLLERSPLFDAFYQEFAPGLFTNATFLDKHVTTQHMFHRIDNFNQFNGASFGDGKYAYSGRVTVLPYYECDGRYLLHLGVAYQFRKGTIPLDFNGGTALPSQPGPQFGGDDLVRFRARQSIRDAVGAQGDPSRVVDTGNVIADHVQSINAELLWYHGPAWLQSEAVVSRVDNAAYPATAAAVPVGRLVYYGTYAQVGYILTGENRGYDRRFGRYDRVVPRQNFVKDGDGCGCWGWGAWEVVYRFAYVNLDDGPVQGGTYAEHTVGVNWYWTPGIKFQFNYLNGFRSVPAAANSGTVQGFALRGVLEF